MRRAALWARHLGLMYAVLALTGGLGWVVYGVFSTVCLLFPDYLNWCLALQQRNPELSKAIEYMPAGAWLGMVWLLAVFVWTWWKALRRMLPLIHGGPR